MELGSSMTSSFDWSQCPGGSYDMRQNLLPFKSRIIFHCVYTLLFFFSSPSTQWWARGLLSCFSYGTEGSCFSTPFPTLVLFYFMLWNNSMWTGVGWSLLVVFDLFLPSSRWPFAEHFFQSFTHVSTQFLGFACYRVAESLTYLGN